VNELEEKPRTTMSFMNDDGYVETIDAKTGDTLFIQNGVHDNFKNKEKYFDLIKTEDGREIYVQKGLYKGRGKKPRTQIPFSEMTADLICQRIVEGETLVDICKSAGYPSYCVLSSWRRRYPYFDSAIKEARFDRAEHFHDMALKEAKATASKDDAPAQKIKVETYKWAAKVGNPDTYGDKTKISGDSSAPIKFVVDTGIRRVGDEGFREVTPGGSVVEEKKQLEVQKEEKYPKTVENKPKEKINGARN